MFDVKVILAMPAAPSKMKEMKVFKAHSCDHGTEKCVCFLLTVTMQAYNPGALTPHSLEPYF